MSANASSTRSPVRQRSACDTLTLTPTFTPTLLQMLTNILTTLRILPLAVQQQQQQRHPLQHSNFRCRTPVLLLLLPCLLLLGLVANVPQCKAEYFSSVQRLQTLADIELGLVETFQQYFDMQQQEFAEYRKFIAHVKAQHSLAQLGVEDYLGNPINAFTLIKRMVIDWNELHESLKQSAARLAFQAAIENFERELQVPDEQDLHGAVMGLARIQTVYNLDAYNLADGDINGVSYGVQLTWHECYEIATNLYDNKEFLLAINWFEVVLLLLNDMDEKEATTEKFKLDTMEYLALAHFDLGNRSKAIEYLDQILHIQPENFVKDTKVYMQRSEPGIPPSIPAGWKEYTNLCRGIRAPYRGPPLSCILTTAGSAYFVLAPLREEQLSLDPEVSLFHGVLQDTQTAQLLQEAEKHMKRSKVRGSNGNFTTNARISQTAWMQYNTPVTRSINNLVSQINGFDMRNAEPMQVVNYGIGGQYDPHYDFLNNRTVIEDFIGNRIATAMFFLSNVEQGGYTVFPRVNVFVRPVKGAMLYWYNLHRSLDEDYRTLHAGCPVITGSKNIATVWIHSGYQEFIRPCALKRDHYKSIAFKET